MELREFVDNFDSSETIRIVQKEEVLYEGKIETLAKLLHCRVQRLSGIYLCVDIHRLKTCHLEMTYI